MSEPFIGEVRQFPFNFAPKGWALCNGQLLPIAQNQALFSLLGTTYGGNGTTTFGLPDLRGRVAVHPGSGITLGQTAGEEAHTLLSNEMPMHNHMLQANKTSATQSAAANNVWAPAAGSYGSAGSPDTSLAPTALQSTGGGQPHSNMQPYLVVSCCIALTGIFPTRS